MDPFPVASEASEGGRWALLIALGFLVVGVPLIAWLLRWAWWFVAGKRRGGQEPQLWWGRALVVGKDNRVSTSKTAALVWTYTLAGSLLSFVIARWIGHPAAYEELIKQGVNAQYALLIGGPLGAAILAKGIVSGQVESGSAVKSEGQSATPAQLVQGDEGETDLGDVQYVLFNVVALVFFYGELLRSPQAGLPNIPEVLLGLTSVAAVGFVGKKALAGPAGISEVTPAAAKVGDPVTIVTAGLAKSEEDLPAVSVAFGEAAADRRALKLTTTTTFGVLVECQVPPDAAGKVEVKVSVPNKQISWSSFAVIPTISASKRLEGHPGAVVEVMTSGVVGLGATLPGLSVKIGGKDAAVALGVNECLRVSVPADVEPGPSKIELNTPGGAAQAVAFQVLP